MPCIKILSKKHSCGITWKNIGMLSFFCKGTRCGQGICNRICLLGKELAKENREIAVGLDERAESWAKEQYQNYLTTGDRTRLPLDFESLDAAFRKELYAFVKRYRLIIDKDEVREKIGKRSISKQSRFRKLFALFDFIQKGANFLRTR